MTQRVLLKTKGGVRMVREDGSISPLELDEPAWASDETVTSCCGKEFGFFNRKHHCRRSGKVVCATCSTKVPLLRMAFSDPVRVHNDLVAATEEESKFFAKELPILVKGGVFNLEREDGSVVKQARCKLSADHKMLQLESKSDSVSIDIASNTVHMIDAGKKDKIDGVGTIDVLTIKSKSSGQLDFHSTDKDFAKKWRKAIKHMIKVLHGDKKRLAKKTSATSAGSPK